MTLVGPRGVKFQNPLTDGLAAMTAHGSAPWHQYLGTSDGRASGTMTADSGICGRLVRVFAIDLVPELVRTGRAHEEVERSRPETVAMSDRLQPAYQKVLERNPGGGVGSGQRCS